MKPTPNVVALRELRDQIHIQSLKDVDEDPNTMVFCRLLELFQEFELPVEVIGAIYIDVHPAFFENNKFAFDIMLYIVQDCKRIYDLICERVQDEDKCLQIFKDYVNRNISLTWYNCCINDDSLSEDDY